MSNLEHAIENAIFSFYTYEEYDNPLEEWEKWDSNYNLEGMSQETIKIIKECAKYIRYTLCQNWEEYAALIEKYIKE